MKDFIKWLGVNEKVAKVAVWLLIIMVFLIVINTSLSSLGFPHYQITYDNIKDVSINKLIDNGSRCVICFLNFYATMLLIFRIKETKNIFKYSIMYVLLNIIVTKSFGYIASQVFIFTFYLIFPYLYSKKNWKYIIYGFTALMVNTVVEAIMYVYKLSLVDVTQISRLTRSLLSVDYFIIMAIIILVKEIYLKKRGEINGELAMVGRIQKRRNSSKESSKKSSKQN